MIFCSCHNISESQIADFLKKHPHLSKKDLCRKTKIGTDCGICLNSLEDLYKDLGNMPRYTNNKKKTPSHYVQMENQ